MSSCRKDFETVLPTTALEFSKDTVYLDTVFSNIGSSTYQLKVYNRSNKNIGIPSITLGRKDASQYRLSVDGASGKVFENVEILAKDSIYIFIETTINYQELTNPIYTDSIVFSGGPELQSVNLVTLVKDAHFLYPSRLNGFIEKIPIGTNSDGDLIEVNGFYLNQNTVFNSEKPYVIYGYCAIPEQGTLSILPGASIFFHANSGLIAEKNSSLMIQGSLENKVTLEGDRMESSFSDTPGQWGAIWLRAGSKESLIEHAIIKNATIGIISDSISDNPSPSLVISNTEIYNSSKIGLLGRSSNIKGENLVINNSGQSSFAGIIGGTYNFTHCTFTNYWSQSLRQYPSVMLNNYYLTSDGTVITEDLYSANFVNCIIDGNSNIELIVDKANDGLFNFMFENNLIKFNDPTEIYTGIEEMNLADERFYLDNILNQNPDFLNPYENQLNIGKQSAGIGKAKIEESQLIPFDLLGTQRLTPADIGAFEYIEF